MLKHIVFWKIKDNEDKEKNMEQMIKMLYSLDGRIKGLESVELGYNLDSTSEYDVVLCAVLKSPGALKFYQNHPDHIKCKEFISTIAEARVAFDFVPEDPEFLDISPDILDFDKEKAEEEPMPEPVVEPIPEPISKLVVESTPEPIPEPVVESTPEPISKPVVEPTPEPVPEPTAEPIISVKEDIAEQKPGKTEKLEKPAEKSEKPESNDTSKTDNKKMQIDVSDIQTNSSANYQSLVRPVIPGINAPIDFVPTEEPEPDYSIIPEFVQKSIKETQEDYDILEAVVDEEDPYGFEIASEPTEISEPVKEEKPVEQVKPIEPTKPVEPVKPIESVKPVEQAKPIEPIKPVKQVKPIEPIKPVEQVKPIEPIKPVEQAKPVQMPFASKPKVAEEDIPPIPVKHRKSRLFGGKKEEEETPKELDMTNKWRCPSCGRVNADYVGTCGCGMSKPLDDFGFMASPKAEPSNTAPSDAIPSNKPEPKHQEQASPNSWICPKCGALHANFITDCKCGYVKPNGFTVKSMTDGLGSDKSNGLPPAAPMKVSDITSKSQREIGTDMPKPVSIDVSTVDKEKAQDLRFGERRAKPSKPPVSEPKKPMPPPTPVQAHTPAPAPAPISATKPEKKSLFGRKKKEAEAKPEIDMTKFWKCPSCGKYNHNYVGTCGCGGTKPFEFDFAETKEEDTFVPKSNAWKCPKCGKLNNNFVSVCHCGYNKSEDEE